MLDATVGCLHGLFVLGQQTVPFRALRHRGDPLGDVSVDSKSMVFNGPVRSPLIEARKFGVVTLPVELRKRDIQKVWTAVLFRHGSRC